MNVWLVIRHWRGDHAGGDEDQAYVEDPAWASEALADAEVARLEARDKGNERVSYTTREIEVRACP